MDYNSLIHYECQTQSSMILALPWEGASKKAYLYCGGLNLNQVLPNLNTLESCGVVPQGICAKNNEMQHC